MSEPPVTINIAVRNGEKYIHRCLDSVFGQSYPRDKIELNILDNNSTDGTVKIIEESGISGFGFAKFSLIKGEHNLGMWPGQEWLFNKYTSGKYIIALSVDVIMDYDFIKNAVAVMEKDKKIGALQAKIYRYKIEGGKYKKLDIIDTVGFEIYKSRRVVNVGHGEKNTGQHDKQTEIFGVEGAIPVFRRAALENIGLNSLCEGLTFTNGKVRPSQYKNFVDKDFFWYGDDLDIAWRMNMLGWKHVYVPSVIAWHDRQTTKSSAGGRFLNFVKIRKTVPVFKRRLDYRNWFFTVIKNDYWSNVLHDLPHILKRQFMLWVYFLIFEPWMLLEISQIVKRLPKMLKRRREVIRKAKVSAKEIRKWFK